MPFGSGIIGQSMSSQTHLAHVGTLSGPGRARIWPVIQERLVEDQPCLSVSCCLSAASVRFLGHPVPAAELRLPHGRPTGRLFHPDPNGVSTFHTSEIRPGWVLPLPRGGGVHPDGRDLHYPAPTASQRPALHPAATTHRRGLGSRDIIGSSLTFTRPVFPGPVAPGWNGNPWATTPELRTPPLPATHVRLGTGPRTLTRNYRFDIRTSNT